MQSLRPRDGGRALEELQLEETQIDQLPTPPSEYHRLADGERVSLARAFGGRSLLRETMETVLLTIIIFLILNTTTGRFQVRGSSMEPTLHDGQYLVIGKLVYWVHPPERGDVIVFEPPTNPSDDYIKRIVGLPGEQIEIQLHQALPQCHYYLFLIIYNLHILFCCPACILF